MCPWQSVCACVSLSVNVAMCVVPEWGVVGVHTPPYLIIRSAKQSFGVALSARCQLSTTVGTQLLHMRGSDVFNINTAQHRYVTCTWCMLVRLAQPPVPNP